MVTTHVPSSDARFAAAGVVLDALASHDFDALVAALEDDASMSALLPRGFCEWSGASEIGAAFDRWFGDVAEFEVADASVGRVGALLQLRWRLWLRGARFGDDPMIVEQHAYARTGPTGRIQHLSLLCSGFWKEHEAQPA